MTDDTDMSEIEKSSEEIAAMPSRYIGKLTVETLIAGMGGWVKANAIGVAHGSYQTFIDPSAIVQAQKTKIFKIYIRVDKETKNIVLEIPAFFRHEWPSTDVPKDWLPIGVIIEKEQ